MATHKVTAAVQGQIKDALDKIEGDKPTLTQVSTAFRSTGNVQSAIAKAVAPQDAKNKASVVETVAKTAPAPAAKATTKKVALPDAPEGWLPGESSTAFVRYARRLKANGQPVTEYRLAAAKTKAEIEIADAFRAAGVDSPYVLHNHVTGVTRGFQNHADAYAASMSMAVPDLARSVVVSIGGDKGLERVSSIMGTELRQRILATIADDESAEQEESNA